MLGRSHAQEFDDHSSGAQKALFAGRNRTGRRSQSCVSGVASRPDALAHGNRCHASLREHDSCARRAFRVSPRAWFENRGRCRWFCSTATSYCVSCLSQGPRSEPCSFTLVRKCTARLAAESPGVFLIKQEFLPASCSA